MKIEQRDGVWCPKYDTDCFPWTMTELWIPKHLADTCDKLGIARQGVIHAGGNMGIYTMEYARLFEQVYVFEPESTNFSALVMNCVLLENVFPYKAALNNVNAPITLVNRAPNSAGNWQVGHAAPDTCIIPSITIDNLGLSNVSLIHLDMEGFEGIALQGAEQTIRRCKPLIAFEVLGGWVSYSYTLELLTQYLVGLGYLFNATYGNEMMFYTNEPK